MRRRVLLAMIGGLIAMTLLCGAGAMRAWSRQGRELIMPGAADARIERQGPFRLRITYQLPRDQTVYDLTAHLGRQGWRRLRLSNAEPLLLSFVRPGWRRETREILVVAIDPQDRTADIEVSRCFRVGSWANCL